MTEQLTLTVEAPVVDAPSSKQHRSILVALLQEGERGLTGEECKERCGFRASHIATTRLGEMASGSDERFPIPLTCKSGRRPTASGRTADIYRLTDAGFVAAQIATGGR